MTIANFGNAGFFKSGRQMIDPKGNVHYLGNESPSKSNNNLLKKAAGFVKKNPRKIGAVALAATGGLGLAGYKALNGNKKKKKY